MSELVCSAENSTHKLSVYYDSDSENPRDWDHDSVMMCFSSRYNYGDKHSYNDIESWAKDTMSCVAGNVISYESIFRYAVDNGYMLPDKSAVFYYTGKNKTKNADEIFDDETEDILVERLIRDCFELQDLLDLLEPGFVILPVYKYEHSGVALSTSPFGCRWDSGQIGVIYTELKPDHFPGMSEDEIGTEENRKKIVDCMTGEVDVYSKWINNEVFRFELESKVVCPHCGNTEYEYMDSCGGFYELDGIKEYLPEIADELFNQLKS